MPGLIIAAPSSGSGKTTVTLGLLRALRNQGRSPRGAKSGPDYIDPRFHEAACGHPCPNLDAWAMSSDRIAQLASGDGLLIVEGAMGLFDGAPPSGRGSVADLARQLRLPVILVVDASRMAQSVTPLVAGFAAHDPNVKIAGVILNKTGSSRHADMLRTALSPLGIPVLGALPRDSGLSLPSRHLGLVQASEHPELEDFLDHAATYVAHHVDLQALLRLAKDPSLLSTSSPAPPFAHYKRIAVARDQAFRFLYPHLLDGWQNAGVVVQFFSPLADDPVPEADLVYLPGGYPELHAQTLSDAKTFIDSLKNAAQRADIYGECGGYMVLGEQLTDVDGTVHSMAGLLALKTSFAPQDRKLHLGYRRLSTINGPLNGDFTAHEFHYAKTLQAEGTPLFAATNAEGAPLPDMGLVEGRVAGSFAHIIDHAPRPTEAESARRGAGGGVGQKA